MLELELDELELVDTEVVDTELELEELELEELELEELVLLDTELVDTEVVDTEVVDTELVEDDTELVEDELDEEELELDELDEELDDEVEIVEDEVVVEVLVVVVPPSSPLSHPHTVTYPPLALVVIRTLLSALAAILGIGYAIVMVSLIASSPLKIRLASEFTVSKRVTVFAAAALIEMCEITNLFPEATVHTA